MRDTIFDKIVSAELPCYKIWEDSNYLAFLTPFPNTPGFSIVIPKNYMGDYLFELSDEEYSDFLVATKKVAKLLEKALKVKRVALVFEGTGIAYAHAKLIPLHGKLGEQTDVWSKHNEFHEEYIGHITTVEGPEMDKQRITKIQKIILATIK